MGTRAPRSPRDQKLNRPNKDGGSGRKTYGRSGELLKMKRTLTQNELLVSDNMSYLSLTI